MSGHDPRIGERIASVQQLSGVVGAMRGIAAARAAQSRKQLEGIRAYADIVAEAISEALALMPQEHVPDRAGDTRPRACVLFCSEQGFAGTYNDRVCDLAMPMLQAGMPAYVIGARGDRLLRTRGIIPAWSAPMIAQSGHAVSLANRIGKALTDALSEGRISGAQIVHTTLDGVHLNVVQASLLPLDCAHFHGQRAGRNPLTYLPAPQLFEQLASEYLFAQLTAATVDSHAAENTARLQAMASAQDNIARQLEQLHLDYQIQRQDTITDELIELAAGML